MSIDDSKFKKKTKVLYNNNKSVVFLVGATIPHMPMSVIYLHSEGQILMGRHVSDTQTVCWKIYYVHSQSGRTLFLDILCQVSGGCLALCSGETNTDR